MIDRRAMLQSLVGTFGAGFGVSFVAEGHPMQQHLSDHATVVLADAQAANPDYRPEFLDAHQLETLEALAERVIPGSTRARVAPFLDSLLFVSAAESQRRFLNSLGAFETLATEHHQRSWKTLDAGEQDALLTHASAAPSGPAPSGGPPSAVRGAFDDLREWISGAYYSSEIGMRELGWTGQMTFERLPECEHPDRHRG